MNFSKLPPSVQAVIIFGAIPTAILCFVVGFGLLLGGFLVADVVGGLWGTLVFILLLIYLVIYVYIKIS